MRSWWWHVVGAPACVLAEWLVLGSSRGAAGSKNPWLEPRTALGAPSPRQPRRLLPVATSCHVDIWRKANVGRNSTRPETAGKDLMGGAKAGRAGASRQPGSQRGRRDFHDTSRERAGPKPYGWAPRACKPSRMGGWVAGKHRGCRARSGGGVKLKPGGGGVGWRR